MKLSICIPTYNRKEKVLAQINRIFGSGILDNNNQIELVVSDNCSDDNTYDELVSNFGKEKEIRLFRQETNLGLVGNLYFLFDIAQGDYIWFLSDDDPLNPESIKSLLSLMYSNPKSFYLLNFRTDQSTDVYWRKSDNNLSLFNNETWGGFGLLSVQVLKKSDFAEFYKTTKSSYNLCQPVAVSFYGLVYLDGMICFDIISITHHVGDYSWADRSLQVGSVYLYDSLIELRKFGNIENYKQVITTLKGLKSFSILSVIHILKNRDISYAKRLYKGNLLLFVLFTMLCYGIRSRFLKIFKSKINDK